MVFDRISYARANFEEWASSLRERKIDVQHAIAVYLRLQESEALLKRYEAIEQGAQGGVTVDAGFYAQIRCERIYFRALLLDLLNQEDAWRLAAGSVG